VIQDVIAGSTASQQLAAAVGRGYLELTGYGKALRL
jgi:hypothetical protein